MLDPNISAMHDHHREEERRERIGARADAILKEWVDEAMGDDTKLCNALIDLDIEDLVDTVAAAILANSIGRLHNDVEGLLRLMWRDKAMRQAESEGA